MPGRRAGRFGSAGGLLAMRAAPVAALVALGAPAALPGCGDPCVRPLEQWCGDPPCDELRVQDVTVSGQCDDLAVAHDFHVDAYVTNVWYFDRVSSELVAVHVFSDDPHGSCGSDWYGQRVTCAETCELNDLEAAEWLECE